MRSRARHSVAAFSLVVLTAASAGLAFAAPEVGKPAPEFSAAGSDGQTHALADYRGKVVVLEWLNHGCPFVRKHYDTRNMQALQKEAAEKGVVWLSVISSAPGQQGHSSADKARADIEANDAAPAVVLLDEGGAVGRLYEAKTTPHLFVIGADGTLLYKGAIDDQPTVSKDSVAAAKNYVRLALQETLAGRPVSEPVTAPYGCPVKY
jgi:peroxiredoxin